MTFINTILDAEVNAKETIAQAQATADISMLNANNKATNDFANLEGELKTKRTEAVKEQKPKLMEMYKRVLSVGTARANDIQTQSKKRIEKGVSHILNNLV